MSRSTLFRRWVLAFTLGELLGFGLLPVLGGFVAVSLTGSLASAPRALVLYLVAVAGGLGEGAVLAGFQLGPLRAAVPGVDGRRWVLHTAVAASVAWGAGMLGPTLDDLVGLSTSWQVALGVGSALVILPSIGVAQARLLEGHVPRPRQWITANVVGWLAGLPWTFALPALVPDDAPLVAFGVAMGIGGVLMGVPAGAVTGAWLVRMTSLR